MLSTVPFLTDSALPAVTLFTAQGRYGNNALNGDWELGITSNTNKPPQKQIDHIWTGSVNSATGVTTVNEQFRFGVSNTTAASFRVGGSNISFDYAGQLTGNQPNAIKIWAKASTANSGLTIDNFKRTTPGMAVPMEFPGTSIAVSRSSGPDFQQLVIAGIDFTSGSGPAVELTGNVLMSFGAPAPRGSSLQFHVMAVYVPPVDLDVDSDNDGTFMRSAFEELEEDAGVAAGSSTPTKPGLIVPVGGPRAEMVVEVPAGRTATLALSQGVERVQVYLPVDKALHGLCPLDRPQETPRVSWVDGPRILIGQTCSTVCQAQPTGGDPLAFPLATLSRRAPWRRSSLTERRSPVRTTIRRPARSSTSLVDTAAHVLSRVALQQPRAEDRG
jgi:hypothetical protein